MTRCGSECPYFRRWEGSLYEPPEEWCMLGYDSCDSCSENDNEVEEDEENE